MESTENATFKHGTRVEIWSVKMDGTKIWKGGKIMTRCPKAWGEIPDHMSKEWTRVKYDHGGVLTLHRSHFRIVDNRA